MITKVPSTDWSDHDHFEYMVDNQENDAMSDLEDEPDFAEYLWMENEEEFDKNELQRLEEEDLMKECLEAMLDDEIEAEIAEWQKTRIEENLDQPILTSECTVEHSLLNPFADEFIPRNQILNLGK